MKPRETLAIAITLLLGCSAEMSTAPTPEELEGSVGAVDTALIEAADEDVLAEGEDGPPEVVETTPTTERLDLMPVAFGARQPFAPQRPISIVKPEISHTVGERRATHSIALARELAAVRALQEEVR